MVAIAQSSQAQTFSGPVVHELMKSGAPSNSLNDVARDIAAHFMANMDSDTYRNDRANATNSAAKAGIIGAGAGLQFTFIAPEVAAAPKLAQPAPDAPTSAPSASR